MQNPLDNIEVVRFLTQLKASDQAAFMKMVLLILKTFRTEALEQVSAPETKMEALDTMLNYFQELEEFEECQFILELKQEISGEAL